MKTEIFESYTAFLNRPDKAVNGVSSGPVPKGSANVGCGNCTGCTDIPAGAKVAVFLKLYLYVCIPRINADGSQYIQLGCHLRTRAEWDANFWNNPLEFPDDGSLKSEARKLAYETACKWLDLNAKYAKND